MSIRAVAFDLDGTLYPSWQMALSSIHLMAFHPRLLFAFSRARKEIRRVRPIDDFRITQARLVAAHMKIEPPEAYDLIDRKMYRAWKTSFRCIRPFAGCREVIEELKRRGLKLAVLSDFPVEHKLEFLGLAGYWDKVCTSETVKYLKPNPEPFLQLAKDLGIPPEEILYVGNSYHYDIVGARRTGMSTAHFTRKVHHDTVADFSFHRYALFLEYIDSWCGEGDPNPDNPGEPLSEEC